MIAMATEIKLWAEPRENCCKRCKRRMEHAGKVGQEEELKRHRHQTTPF
jgi:hypothetical protein